MTLLWLITVLLAGGALSWLLGSPLLGSLLFGSSLLGRANTRLPRWIALATLLLAGGMLVEIWHGGPLPGRSWYAEVALPWIPRFGIGLQLGLDGLSLLMVALTVVLGIVAVLASGDEIKHRHGFYHFNVLWMVAGVIGVFTAFDLFLFYFFWEVMLIPAYLLIAVWGAEQRQRAAMQFFVFTQSSGLLMLLSFLVLVYAHHAVTGVVTFNYFALLGTQFAPALAQWAMIGLVIAFLVKLPGVPFHTWLPDAYTQAPTGGSILLAGIMSKTGAYGLLRFVVPMFPEASRTLHWPMMLLGALGVVYGGMLAFAQSDVKRLVAYSSLSHMGFVLLGIFAWNELALQGAVLQMVAHGVSIAALFVIVGVLAQRVGSREVSRMSGVWAAAPKLGAMGLIVLVATLGMPGFGNFVAEFMVLLGTFKVSVAVVVVAGAGLVLAALYALSLMQRAFQGPPGNTVIADIGVAQLTLLLSLIGALVYLGVHPQPVFDLWAPTLSELSARVPGL